MDIIVSGSQKERVVVIPTSQGKREYHFYADRESFKRMLVEYGGAEYQYLASIRSLLYVGWKNVSVEIVYGVWDLKPVVWSKWDKSVIVNFYVDGFFVQYIIEPIDYEAWKTIRKMIMLLDKEGIQLFPQELENL